MKSLKFFKPTLATTVAIVLAWLLAVRPAQAGFIVTRQQVGPDVVTTGSGAIDLTGLTLLGSSGHLVSYGGRISGPTFGGRRFGIFVSSASGDTVGIGGIPLAGVVLTVPAGYVSGTALSGSTTYSDSTLGQLIPGTPGTYVWRWGTGANQNFTLQVKIPVPASTAIWYLNNNAFVASTSAPTLPVGWGVVGVADFNGDSQPDYLLYNASHQTAVWYLNNNVFVGAAFGPTLPANWKVVGVADFDGDGKPDYLLFNPYSQQTAIWYLSGTSFVSGAFGPSLPNGWDLVAVGDFNADGKPDYVLWKAAQPPRIVLGHPIITIPGIPGGQEIWYLNNNALISRVSGPTLPSNWIVVAH